MTELRDAHVHCGLIDLRAVRAGGISAVLDLGGVPAELAALRIESLDPASGLPRIEFAGAFLTAVGGYPSDRSWAAAGSWREVQSILDAETAVGEQVAMGASLVKVAHNVDAGPVLDPEELAALVQAAHAEGVEVIAHVQGAGAVEAALDAGVDQFAHTPWTEALEPGLLRAAGSQQSCWISTLSIHNPVALDVAVGNLRGYLEYGGVVIYGTDLGNGPLPLGVNRAEMRALRAAGLSADDVLAAMTDPAVGGF